MYEVFLVSRNPTAKERHGRRDNTQAVADGLAATGGPSSAAAAIMVLAFGSSILGGERIIELFGVGLASAVLLDALIVRSVLVPALMILIGDANSEDPEIGWTASLFQRRRAARAETRGEHSAAAPEPAAGRDKLWPPRSARAAAASWRAPRPIRGLTPTTGLGGTGGDSGLARPGLRPEPLAIPAILPSCPSPPRGHRTTWNSESIRNALDGCLTHGYERPWSAH